MALVKRKKSAAAGKTVKRAVLKKRTVLKRSKVKQTVKKKPVKRRVGVRVIKKVKRTTKARTATRKVPVRAKRKKTVTRKKVATRSTTRVKTSIKRSKPKTRKKNSIKAVTRSRTRKIKTKKLATKPLVIKKVVKPRRSIKKKMSKVQADEGAEKNPARITEIVSVSIRPYAAQAGEEYMNSQQQQHFRNLLHQWKQQLLADMNQTVHHLHEATALPDLSDRATQEEAFNVELRTRDRDHHLIKKIEEALQKLDKRDYGYCDSCGAQIGIRRLEARPTATLCIDCKTLDELRERAKVG